MSWVFLGGFLCGAIVGVVFVVVGAVMYVEGMGL